MAVHFGSRNEWKQKCEQAQPLINKIFSEMEKMSRSRCDLLYFCFEEIIVDENLSKHCTLIMLLRKTSVRC